MAISETQHFTPVQRFWRLLKPDQREIRNVYVYSIFNGLVNLSLPLGIQAIVNLIIGGQISTSWILLVIFVVMGIAATGILQIFQMRITENLQQKIFTRASLEFAYRIPAIKMEALYKHYAPELVNRIFDIVSVQKGLSKILIEFTTAALYVIFGLALLSFYHPFFIIFAFILVLLVVAIFRFTAKRGLKTSLEESKYKYQLAHWLEELARTSTTFKLAGNNDLPLQKADGYVSDYLGARESHFKVLIQQYSLTVVFKVLVAIGLLVIGGILVMEQQMNIGQFVAAEIIILTVMTSAEKIILSLENIYDVLTALEKVGQVTDLELEEHKGLDPKSDWQQNGITVELENIRFSYPDSNKKILNNLSLTINSGERLLITGLNGAGKRTLLHILAGLYDIQEGSITYNGLPKGNLNMPSLRSMIGFGLIQEKLFEGTILENISMGREAATFENVKWAVENLGLTSFIKNMPDGYDTWLNPEGKRLSRSIIIKMLLARSIAAKPSMLLLEDSFEILEGKERKKIIDFLMSDEHKWAIVVVSSDQYLAKKADRIIIMKEGSIVANGTLEDLKSNRNSKDNGYA